MKSLEDIFCSALQGSLADRVDEKVDYRASISYVEPQFGHLASNIAFKLAPELGLKPMELASQIAVGLKNSPDFTDVNAVAPGFINIRFTQVVIDDHMRAIAEHFDDFAHLVANQQADLPKMMVMDYSHPNIGKPMGVHHLLSTVIGDAIKRTYRALGTEVVADNFIGDLGTQFGKLIHAVKAWGDLDAIKADPIAELLKLYVKFHNEADNDLKLEEAGRIEYKKLEDGDPENRALWQKIVGWSRAEIQPIYDELGIEFDVVHGESFYEGDLVGIIERGEQMGVFEPSQGALVYTMQDPASPPALVRKKDGATLYLTRDLARIAYWEKTWHPDLMLVVVDNAQSFYLTQVFEVADALKLTDARNVHVSFGRMRFADQSMSTRKGNILLLHDLITEAKRRSRELVGERATSLVAEEQAQLADILAIGALKYSILNQNRQSDITFDWAKMLTFEGNSAPYLCYSVVRARSIARKALTPSDTASKDLADSGNSEHEQQLATMMSRYSAVLHESAISFRPNTLANYIYELAQQYNNFYNRVEFIKASPDNQKRRLELNRNFISIMQSGLSALGIAIPDKM